MSRNMFKFRLKQHSVLPGFGFTMGFTVIYMSLIVLIPLAGLVLKTTSMGWSEFFDTIFDLRALASYRLSFGAAVLSAMINAVFGFILAWVLVRYTFPGKKIIDAVVDLPFALPTAVSGIALTSIYTKTGWLGSQLEPMGIRVAFTWIGVVVALTLIGMPFVVRTLQPALAEIEVEIEEAAASLGAHRWQTFRRVILPTVLPALLTGFSMAMARAIGEYGSIVFIAGNIPMKTEITPLLIIIKLEQYDYTGATAIAVVMLVASFFMLFVINILQWWSRQRYVEVI